MLKKPDLLSPLSVLPILTSQLAGFTMWWFSTYLLAIESMDVAVLAGVLTTVGTYYSIRVTKYEDGEDEQ